ncbi:hypothetical protein EFL35_01615 [Weissella paramesenteroides]|uniref:glycoside hydrolase family 55 protein n=1 Tax=Weissella paramesenteroides TaxID=1249 RepID=UPI00223B7E9F|nr:glycoside hydrolase family 55 protein [Weissella paramesenteroides]MCS9983696.1 hypothetical protein [Weissella paramesenteroides]MCS9997941.1 hypothetical protein [Weissella paramesenteroides]MCT0260159.1 hypothetical protein [Weissella paramesenteroides]
MDYGNYKIVSIKSDSQISKSGDSDSVIRIQLMNGKRYANLNDENAVVSVRNDSGFLFDFTVNLSSGMAVVDFKNNAMNQLTPDRYGLQVNVNVNNEVAKYPDDGFVPFTITHDIHETNGELVPQITFDTVLKSVSDEIDKKVGDYLATVAKGDTGEQGKSGENGKDGYSPYISVLDYDGVDNTGNSDSTNGFLNAIADSKAKGRHSLLIPSGKYIISQGIEIDDITVFGEDEWNTVVVVKGEVGFKIGNGLLKNLTVDLTASMPWVEAIQLGYDDDGNFKIASDSKIENIYLMGTFSQPYTTGIISNPNTNNQNDVKGVWGNNIRNIVMRSIGSGIKLVAGSYGWINGNLFENILIKGFYENGVLIDSDSELAFSNQRNYFKNVQVQANGNYAKENSVAYNIKHGSNNVFDNVTEWNDTGGRDDIVSVNFGTSLGSQTFWSVVGNRFINSKFEHQTSGDWREFALNTIDAIIVNFSRPPYLTGTSKFYTQFKGGQTKNWLPLNLLSDYVENPKLSVVGFSNSVTEKGDKYSSYLSTIGSHTVTTNIIGEAFDNALQSGFLTVSTKFGVSSLGDTKIDCSLYFVDGNGNRTVISSLTSFSELLSDNEYAYHVMFDLSSLNNVNYLSFSFSVNTNVDNIEYKYRAIKISNAPVNSISNYTQEHEGIRIEKTLNSLPNSWSDLGVYLPNGIDFNQSLLNSITIGNQYKVSAPILK